MNIQEYEKMDLKVGDLLKTTYTNTDGILSIYLTNIVKVDIYTAFANGAFTFVKIDDYYVEIVKDKITSKKWFITNEKDYLTHVEEITNHNTRTYKELFNKLNKNNKISDTTLIWEKQKDNETEIAYTHNNKLFYIDKEPATEIFRLSSGTKYEDGYLFLDKIDFSKNKEFLKQIALTYHLHKEI